MNARLRPELNLRPASLLRGSALVVLAAIALGLASAARMLVLYRNIGVQDAVLSGLLDWGLWVPFVPLILIARRRLPLVGDRPVWSSLAHVLFAFVLSFGQALAFAFVTTMIRGTALLAELRSATLIKLHAGVFVYWAVLLGLEALDAQRRVREETTHRAQVGRQLSEARFAALEGHLRPHFLFNTLNSIAAYIRRDPEQAEAMIAKLGGLLRRTVADREVEISLEDELAFVRDYLDIEHARFGDRLVVDVRMDADCAGALVPRLALQPIVENAVQHGIGPRIEGGTVAVQAERRNGQVCVRVVDDGVGWSHADGSERGFGLAAIRERIDVLYGERGAVDSSARPGGGTIVELSIPFRTEGGD